MTWRCLRRVLGRLGSVLAPFWPSKKNLEPSKIKPPLQRERGLRDFPISAMNLPFGAIWVPTCLHFGSIFRALGRLWGLLGPTRRVLRASWGVLGASWGHLGATSKKHPKKSPPRAAKHPSKKPGLAMEREARDYSDAFALSGYLLRFSALAICKNSEN